ncbi:MAG: YdbL family protein [Polyangiaceae bacterium]|nr:YdbL family protein [Polyangiaceae bacterium]
MIRVLLRSFAFAVLAILLAGTAGCIGAPDIVMVDRATALEQQAGGSFNDLERKLSRTSIQARPVPLTPKQFEALGIKPLPLQDTTELTDADRVDALLTQHCIGEGRDGLLVETRAACVGVVDRAEARDLIGRVNQARRQLWRWMHEQRPGASAEQIQKTWSRVHARGVVCGGWIESEGEAGKWEAKKC